MQKHPVRPGPQAPETAVDLQEPPDRIPGPDPVRIRSFPGLIRITDKPGRNPEITAPIWASSTLRSSGCWWEPVSRTWQARPWELPLVTAALESDGYVIHHDDHRLPASARRAARNAALGRARLARATR